MGVQTIEQVLWWLNIPLLGLVSLRLLWNGLATKYPSFVFLIVFLALRNTVLELLTGEGGIVVWYYRVWLVTEPMLVIAYTLAVFELYALALARYEGLRTASRRVLVLAMVIATTVSVLSIFPDIQFNATAQDQQFLLINVLRRGLYSSLLVFLVLLVSFITIFPIRLSRNSIVHIILFAVSFLFFTVSSLTVNLQGADVIPIFNLAAALVGVIASMGWFFFLTPAGEGIERTVTSSLSAEQAGVFLDKLQSINDSLANSRKWF